MLPSPPELVARFLRANGYNETLNTFITEAGLPLDAGTTSGPETTIEQILQEKKSFDLSLSFEKLGTDDKDRQWLSPAPSRPKILDSLPTKSNILNIALLECLLPSVRSPKPYFAVTTADRRLHLIDPSSPSYSLIHSYSTFQDSPILDLAIIQCKFLLVASMSGKLLLYHTETNHVLDERKDHGKYIVKLATWSDGTSTIVASAGWDAKIFIYELNISGHGDPQLGEPIAAIGLPSIPETILFIQSPDSSRPILLLSRRDSTFLYYYAVPLAGSDQSGSTLLGKQNLAPHSNAWVAFTPSDVQLCPMDASLIAVATSSTPHMKLQVVRLLIPPEDTAGIDTDDGLRHAPITQASQSRADLLIQDREEAAILVNVSTMAPQTAYSTPRLVWRADGSGIFVSSDDGTVRGFEATTGKLASTLEAHEPGSKLRCLWAGLVKTRSDGHPNSLCETEVLLSGGFDQRLILWSTL